MFMITVFMTCLNRWSTFRQYWFRQYRRQTPLCRRALKESRRTYTLIDTVLEICTNVINSSVVSMWSRIENVFTEEGKTVVTTYKYVALLLKLNEVITTFVLGLYRYIYVCIYTEFADTYIYIECPLASVFFK